MSEWEQRVREHPVWNKMAELGPTIDASLAVEDLETSAIVGLERVRTVLAFCGRRLAGTDPLLLMPSTMDGISSAFANASAELSLFCSNKDFSHVMSANANAD